VGYSTPGEAISGAQTIHKLRMRELNLDISGIVGKRVINFHWDDHHLALEFENGLFLELKSENQLLHIQVIDKTNITTERNVIINTFFPSNEFFSDDFTSVWTPSEIAQTYTGQKFINIQIGKQDAWIYFENMPYVISCLLMKIEECDELFLSWDESQ
jgi:hypothetical protein